MHLTSEVLLTSDLVMGNWRTHHYRFSEIIAIICIPATFFLSVQIAFLSRDIKNASVGIAEIKDNVDDNADYDYPTNVISDEDILSLTSVPKEFEQIQVAPPLNNTGRGQESIMILTSIPRTGQSNLREIIKIIKGSNGFLTISPPRRPELTIEIPSVEKQRNVAMRVSSLNFSAAIIDHFAFIDFNKFGIEQPIQVSMVRDPVERAISMYYYVRAPFAVVEENNRFPAKSLPDRKFLRKSMESCLMNKSDTECSFKEDSPVVGHTSQFFCGHEIYCRLFSNQEGLEAAKKHVTEKFAVVGVLEDLEKTLIVLENYVPKFFKGAYKAYQDLKTKNPMALQNRNMYKPELESEFRKLLEKRFSTERKFYNFIKLRLNQQYEKLLERSKIKEKLILNKGK
ncbi:UNVERIFIED_CONTAM: hypothetical protein RMT77_006787 [Armadillidium vulgare]